MKFHFFNKGIWVMGFLNCHSFFYYPDSNMHYDPKRQGYPYQEISMNIGQDRLTAWLFPTKGQAKAIVMQFHGNAENMSSHYLSLIWVVDEGFHLYTFDYRGYGFSTGKPTPKGTIEDALLAYRTLIKQKENQNLPIIIYGQSLGGKVAQDFLHFLTKDEISHIKGVVLEGSFSSYQEIMIEKLWETGIGILFIPFAFVFVQDPKLPEISYTLPPFLIIHGQKDRVISYKHGQKLAQKYQAPLLSIENGGHLDAYFLAREKILAYFRAFLSHEK